ncbi:MAG: hypothetical protein LQ345_000500 [Seirophora villosa]|nr:MAG: hypothetical protein LQ345_000500 [Seirophora villosa]
MPSTLSSNHPCQNVYLPPLQAVGRPVLGERKETPTGEQGRNNPKHFFRSADTRHGLRTPPGDMSGLSVNPLLAPSFGGSQYKSAPCSRPLNKTQQPHISYHNRSQSHEKASTETNGLKDPHPRSQNGIDESSIVSYLQIPSSINGSKGSLAEFAAQITCLFWFESSFNLLFVEECKVTPTPIEPLVSEAIPTMGFRKWVVSILSTTQVSQNVILLALMFIYRLKKLNPGVKGKLVLDDNTYTNKTWAEVSGISVQEIHIMEVEFLSNMRYTLYASENEWKAWHVKLGKFWKYFEASSKAPIEAPPRVLNPPVISPSGLPNLPSPPSSTHTSPPYSSSRSFHSSTPTHPYPLSMPPYLPPIGPSPLGPVAELGSRPAPRKRSHDQALENSEPPAKRPAPTIPASIGSSRNMTPSTLDGFTPNTSFATPSTGHLSALSGPRLPTPNLSVCTGYQNSSGHHGSPSVQLPLPAGSSKFNGLPGAARLPQSGMLPSLPQNMRFNHDGGSHGSSPVSDWPSRHTPYATSVGTPSPTSVSFPQSAHTPTHLSPAAFPLPRNSPYKPVRSVNTLLVPPPSASMQNAPTNLRYSQMHYQPLGKPVSQSLPGVLPMLPHDSWGQPQDRPLYLPQPKFAS